MAGFGNWTTHGNGTRLMSKPPEENEDEDLGARFTEVVLHLPSESLVDQLAAVVQERVRQNMEQTRRVFIASTLPIPSAYYLDSRTSNQVRLVHGSFTLEAKVRDALMAGLSGVDVDKITPTRDAAFLGNFVRERLIDTKEGHTLEYISTAELLGKYWYRDQQNQPTDYIDALIMGVELEALRKDEEPVPEDFWDRNKSPTAKRRK
jgi:hypothetical protein